MSALPSVFAITALKRTFIVIGHYSSLDFAANEQYALGYELNNETKLSTLLLKYL